MKGVEEERNGGFGEEGREDGSNEGSGERGEWGFGWG